MVTLVALPLLAWAVTLSVCTTSWAVSQAHALQPQALDEVTKTVGPRYQALVEATGVETAERGPLFLPRWWADYSVRIRSRECTSFILETSTSLFVGPFILDYPVGGIHDWSLFRDLDEWSRPRRIAYLSYIAQNGNSVPVYVRIISPESKVTLYERSDVDWADAMAIGAASGYQAENMVMTGYDLPREDSELLGFDEDKGEWRLLARSTGDATDWKAVDE